MCRGACDRRGYSPAIANMSANNKPNQTKQTHTNTLGRVVTLYVVHKVRRTNEVEGDNTLYFYQTRELYNM